MDTGATLSKNEQSHERNKAKRSERVRVENEELFATWNSRGERQSRIEGDENLPFLSCDETTMDDPIPWIMLIRVKHYSSRGFATWLIKKVPVTLKINPFHQRVFSVNRARKLKAFRIWCGQK